jgi:hypothetical protein
LLRSFPVQDEDISWAEIDAWLLQHHRLKAIQAYRTAQGVGLNEAGDATSERRVYLWRHCPERFAPPSPPPSREEVFARLHQIREPILVIEASWDGDSFNHYLCLDAITATPDGSLNTSVFGPPVPFLEHTLTCWTTDEITGGHPRGSTYKEILECMVREATALGEELAQEAGTEFFLTSADVDFVRRWWDDKHNGDADKE